MGPDQALTILDGDGSTLCAHSWSADRRNETKTRRVNQDVAQYGAPERSKTNSPGTVEQTTGFKEKYERI